MTEPRDALANSYVARENRLTRILLLGRLIAATGEHVCRARNISASGLGLDCTAALAPGDAVTIELRNFIRIAGRVAWTNGTKLGVKFDAPIDVGAVLRHNGGDLRLQPRAPRLPATGTALVWAGGRPCVHRLHDLSQSGCRLIHARPPAPSTLVRIAIPGLPPRNATVRWVRDDQAGYAFHTLLSFADIAGWPHRNAAASGR